MILIWLCKSILMQTENMHVQSSAKSMSSATVCTVTAVSAIGRDSTRYSCIIYSGISSHILSILELLRAVLLLSNRDWVLFSVLQQGWQPFVGKPSEQRPELAPADAAADLDCLAVAFVCWRQGTYIRMMLTFWCCSVPSSSSPSDSLSILAHPCMQLGKITPVAWQHSQLENSTCLTFKLYSALASLHSMQPQK